MSASVPSAVVSQYMPPGPTDVVQETGTIQL